MKKGLPFDRLRAGRTERQGPVPSLPRHDLMKKGLPFDRLRVRRLS